MHIDKEHRIYNAGYTLELLADDIVYIAFDGVTVIDLEIAKRIKEFVLELVEGRKFKSILDFRGVEGVTNMDSRKYMADNNNFNNLKICDAFVTDKVSTNLLIAMYLKLFTPETPTEVFGNMEDAKEWVNSFEN